jgi:CheY-like chemotaxis protein
MKTIWIVDDDEEMLRAVQLLIKLLGMESRTFLAARPAGLELLAGKHPDLFILDVSMPEVSGMEMLDFLKKRKDLKDIPVIMLSTEAAEVQVEFALSIGADAYITKPVFLGELETAIRKAFQAHGIEF